MDASSAASAAQAQAMMEAAVESIKTLLSPLLILVCVALIFFGIFTAQVYAYWFTYQNDATSLRIFVLVLWLFELLHTVFCMHMLYTYFIEDIGAPLNATIIVWSAAASIYAEVTIAGASQGYFIYRLWALSGKNWIVAGVPSILLLARVAIGFATAVFLKKYDTWVEFHAQQSSRTTTDSGLVLSAMVDILVTLLLTYYLHKQKTSFRRTQHIMQRMMFYSINTGAITMCCSITALFMFNFLNGSLAFGGMVEILSKLYANSVLAMLNARKHLKGKFNDNTNSIPLNFTSQESRGTVDVNGGVRIDIRKDVINDRDREAHPVKAEF
ncbi:hypothetical protein PsYK624_117110 [Phanerochaete sordida]|uniref:DUF6534 domain-containing protein n=1 Tax=Phanerochaete sordida TaxID=48140 RepID=A0A9P3GIE7_9APHY|nr:hypothetical protein PsYK624_117110 [Phanerochaete sordida]